MTNALFPTGTLSFIQVYIVYIQQTTMPPQSRGDVSSSHSFKSPESLTPTLKPYLDNLPTPRALGHGRTTPTGILEEEVEDDMPTPVRPTFRLKEKDESNEEEHEEEEGEEDDDDEEDILDDDEFESHYSRQDSSASSDEEDDDDDDDQVDSDGLQLPSTKSATTGTLHRISSLPASFSTTHLHSSHSTTSLRHHYPGAPPIPPPLYPPFYNRPPTPLPPSPSLTSLLRPPSLLNRSTTSTRPTTPDYSDTEDATPHDTEAAVAHSARRATIIPPTSPKVPTYEYYGFVLYLASSLAFFLYIMWSYLPSPFLHQLGITYYPNRWWSLAIPAWIVMVLCYIYIALACWNVEYLTLGLQRVEGMVDEAGNVAILDEAGRIIKGGSKRWERDRDLEIESRKRKGKSRGVGVGVASTGGSWGRKSKSGNHHHHNRKKDGQRKRRERGKDANGYAGGDDGDGDGDIGRFGYMGVVSDSRVQSGLTWRQIWNEGTDAVMDVPIGGVCEVLYGDGADY